MARARRLRRLVQRVVVPGRPGREAHPAQQRGRRAEGPGDERRGPGRGRERSVASRSSSSRTAARNGPAPTCGSSSVPAATSSSPGRMMISSTDSAPGKPNARATASAPGVPGRCRVGVASMWAASGSRRTRTGARFRRARPTATRTSRTRPSRGPARCGRSDARPRAAASRRRLLGDRRAHEVGAGFDLTGELHVRSHQRSFSVSGGAGAARGVLLELAVQRLAVEPQPLRGARLVAALGRQHALDVLALELGERQPARQRAAPSIVGSRRRGARARCGGRSSTRDQRRPRPAPPRARRRSPARARCRASGRRAAPSCAASWKPRMSLPALARRCARGSARPAAGCPRRDRAAAAGRSG